MDRNKLLVVGTPPPPLSRKYTIVGRSLNRRDGLEKVTGRAEYAGDIRLPDMLYGKILRCPHPRARILKIDTRKAESLPGIHAVLTTENTKGWRTYWYEIPQIAFPECLTYEGQEVAAVAAEDVDIAQRALELIEVEYEILTPMLNAEEVLNSPPIPCIADEEYPGRELFDRKKMVVKRGDVKKGFAEADVIIEETYTTQTSYHGTIQTRACVAHWDGKNLTIWDATQGVWNSKGALARAFDLNPENVRVIVKYLGGGFGSKAWSQRISFYAAKLSLMTARPVRIERTRREEFLAHPHRWDIKFYLKMGARRDGTLTAISQRAIVNIGAAAAETNYYAISINWHASNLYACPNVDLEQTGVFTNLQLTGPTRAPFNMAAIFVIESHIDKLARRLGIDPLQLRLKNYTDFGKTHLAPALYGQEVNIRYGSKKLDECMKWVTEAVGWERRKDLNNPPESQKRRGIGMAAFIANQGSGRTPNTAHADVIIKNDGTIHLLIGVVDIGAGQQTVFSMIAAEELGVNFEDVIPMVGDTKDTKYAPSSHSSRVTAEMGPAVLMAAAEARDRLFALAGKMLGVKPNLLESRYGEIYLKSDNSKSIPFKDVCRKIDPNRPIKGSGSRATNPDDPMFATFGAHAAEVEVDMGTGEVTLLRMAAAHDFGKAINPKLCVSQIYGGIEFGVGYALMEEGIFDRRTGKMLNANLHHYRMPTSLDFPPVEVFLLESENPWFAYSAKGGAEVTNTPTPAAIGNAIANALGEIRLNDLPLTTDKIIQAIRNKNKEG